MAVKYTHQEMEREVVFPSGFYTPQKEVRLKYKDREVLYVVGHVVVEASCCGSSNWSYAVVPGYVVRWHAENSQSGMPVTEVESIKEEAARQDVRKIIQDTEDVFPIEFW